MILAILALSVVIAAVNFNMRLSFVIAFIIALAQTYCVTHVSSINSTFIDVLDAFHIDADIHLGLLFAERFVPFAVATIILIAIPRRWVKDTS